MKAQNILAVIVGLSSLVASGSAFALGHDTKPLPHLGAMVAELKAVSLDANLPYGTDLSGGYVRLDRAAKTISLTLVRAYHCPLHALCSKPMSTPVSMTFALDGVEYRECGIRQFTGTMVDAAGAISHQVVIVDRSTESGCASIGPVTPTSVTIRSFTADANGGPAVQSDAQFDGVAFSSAQE